MGYVVLLGRILFASFFLISGINHFSHSDIEHAMTHGVPMAPILVPLSGFVIFLAGLSILLGFKARYGAWVLVIFLFFATFFMHKFWLIADPNNASIQEGQFMKNISLLGGALILAYFGSGPLSLTKD